MKNFKKIFINLIFFLIILPVTLFSHSLWLNVTDYYPEIYKGEFAFTKLYFGWGHHFPVDDFLSIDKIEDFSLISPAGKKEKITPDVKEGFLETVLKLKKEGSWIVAVKSKPGFYTMYLDKNHKMHHKLGPKTGVKGRIIVSLYYQQFAKTIICAGNKQDKSFSKPVGHKLEIIPLKNPSKLRGCGGHFLPVKVLFNGRPAMFKKVFATYLGFSSHADDFAYTTSTDMNGVAKIRLLKPGEWLIKTELKLPPTGDKKEKCNEIHYTATLTLGVK